MRGWKRLSWGLLGAAVIAGCAAGTPRELLDARYAYQRASAGPAAQYSAEALLEARVALERANHAFAVERDSERTRSLAYVALRKAEIAESRARAAVAEQERRQAEQQLAAYRATDEVRMRQELERARSELTEAQRLRAEAEQRRASLQQQQAQEAQRQAEQLALEQARQEEQQRQARLAETQARMDQLNAQLEQERQARLAAERRAAQAEAEARAQTQVANDLRNIRQVQVKEEPRGLVLTLSGSVLFRSGSADLLPVAKRRLDEVAAALNKAQSPLVIEGHTDSQGAEEVNEELSNLRAESVRDYLVEKGVDSARIRTTGLGESRPVASNKNPEGRANNRRVEIVIERGIGGAGPQQVPEAPQPASVPQPVPTP